MDNIKNCPFCGENNVYIGIPNESNHAFIECMECGATIAIEMDDCRGRADYEIYIYKKCMQAWNKRTE